MCARVNYQVKADEIPGITMPAAATRRRAAIIVALLNIATLLKIAFEPDVLLHPAVAAFCTPFLLLWDHRLGGFVATGVATFFYCESINYHAAEKQAYALYVAHVYCLTLCIYTGALFTIFLVVEK